MRPKLKDIVYLKTGQDREAKFITAINIRPAGKQYELTAGTESSWHYDFEFQKDKPSYKTIKGLQ